jgi:hypothetical protein
MMLLAKQRISGVWPIPSGEHIVLDELKKISFQGGWDETSTSASGATEINSMTISDGTIVLDEGCLAIGEN